MRKKLLVLALVLAFVLAAGAALADEPSGTISMEVVSTTVGVGPSWGQAVLTFQGKTHLFKVRGFKMLSVGREKLSVNGDVYKLTNLSDLPGRYKKVETAGLTFIGRPSDLVLQNEKGVTIDVKGKEKGRKPGSDRGRPENQARPSKGSFPELRSLSDQKASRDFTRRGRGLESLQALCRALWFGIISLPHLSFLPLPCFLSTDGLIPALFACAGRALEPISTLARRTITARFA